MRAHAIYLAIIAALTVIVVFMFAKASRAERTAKEIETRFGVKETIVAALPRKEPLRALRAEQLLKPRTYEQYRGEVDGLLARAQALGEFGDLAALARACARALEGGKRLRPIIVLEVARTVSARSKETPPVDAAEVALFVEYLHCASLVVDDLPEFDNDVRRRGAPALHAEAGPAVAQMAALSVCAVAFQNVCRQVDWVRAHCPEIKNVDRIGVRLCGEVSRALGALGAAGGQYMDGAAPETLAQEAGTDAVVELLHRKTASLFELAVVAGWLIAGGAVDQLASVREIGGRVGTAFQLADDISDMAHDEARAAQGRPGKNFANVYGQEVAQRELERNLNGTRYLLQQTRLWTPLWGEIIASIRASATVSRPPDTVPEVGPKSASAEGLASSPGAEAPAPPAEPGTG